MVIRHFLWLCEVICHFLKDVQGDPSLLRVESVDQPLTELICGAATFFGIFIVICYFLRLYMGMNHFLMDVYGDQVFLRW